MWAVAGFASIGIRRSRGRASRGARAPEATAGAVASACTRGAETAAEIVAAEGDDDVASRPDQAAALVAVRPSRLQTRRTSPHCAMWAIHPMAPQHRRGES
jgi:hypothetical protein